MELSANDIAEATVLQSFRGNPRKVLQISTDVVAKLGPGLDLVEAETMRYVRQHTSIPVPRVLGAYEKEGCRHILMEFIDGDMLHSVWETLPPQERSTIAKELGAYVREMRRLQCPEGALIGAINGGPATDRRQRAVSAGPFASELDFNKWQLEQLRPTTPLYNREMYAALHRTDHRLVFTHGDLGFHNVMVKDGHVAAIIDWEFSGWYPEHWDYSKSCNFLLDTDERYLCLKGMYECLYYAEYQIDFWFTKEVRHGGW